MEYEKKLQSDDYTDKNKEYVISMFVTTDANLYSTNLK